MIVYSLPSAPLVELVESRPGPVVQVFAVNTPDLRAYTRAKRDGWVSLKLADRLAKGLGIHPCELWPNEWCEGGQRVRHSVA